MAASSSAAIDLCMWQQHPSSWGEIVWNKQRGGSTGIPARAPDHLIPRNQALANNEAARCSTLARNHALVMQMGVRAPSLDWTMPDSDARDLGRLAGYDRGIKAETVRQRCQDGQLTEAVEALGILVHTQCHVSKFLFYQVLKACLAQKDLALGRRVHALTVKKGYQSDTFLCNHILRMYGSHARLQEAVDVFSMVPEPDAFMWSSIISAHVKHGQDKQAIQLYHQMRRSSGVKPDSHVFVATLQACARGAVLKSGQEVHADVLASGADQDMFVCSCLVDMYAKCGSLEEAQRVFDGLSEKNVVTWSAMIAGYSQQGMGQEALKLYKAMQEEGIITPNSVTFVGLLQACACVGSPALDQGKELHVQIRQQGLQADVVVGGSLVNMYSKCGSLEDARAVFDGLVQKTVVTWNAMIAGYSQHGMGQEALSLYRGMQEEGMVAPNSATFVSLLQACANVGSQALERGKELHAQIRQGGFQLDVVLGGSLVNMYAKCGSLEDARDIFHRLDQKNVVTWNAIIAGYSQQGMGQEALHLYRAMLEEDMVAPNTVTFLCLLQACASVAALHLGRQLHVQIKEQGLQANVLVAGSLITMYGSCCCMDDAKQVFDVLPERDVVIWNALIAGYTRQGDSDEVLALVRRMKDDGIQPDSITFLSLLTVCSHTGLVDKGQEYFKAMSRQYAISPTAAHYTCMVDLLGRAGQLDEALVLVRTMPVPPDAAVWRTLLGACQKWGNMEVGRHAFDEAVKLDKKHAAAYVLMSNIYTDAQVMDEQAQQMQARRTSIGARKHPGQTWWTDMDGLVHSFSVGDTQHSEGEEMLYL